ncbi:hypothetical protein ACQRAB_07085 [Megasphaera elsdenii]|uniref:hypothetical protein n=1 Tax=Megasphaera elsdenii TaxID=907 RepID=UPI003D0928DD
MSARIRAVHGLRRGPFDVGDDAVHDVVGRGAVSAYGSFDGIGQALLVVAAEFLLNCSQYGFRIHARDVRQHDFYEGFGVS